MADPKARDFLARAKALSAAGDKLGALADLRAAMEAAPGDVEAQRLALFWCEGDQRVSAATALLAGAHQNSSDVREALRVALTASDRMMHRLRAHGDGARGWIAWAGNAPALLKFENGTEDWTAELVPNRAHPLAEASYSVADIDAREITALKDARDDSILFLRESQVAEIDRRRGPAPGAVDLTVIVPVYDGYEATAACLDSLFSQRNVVFSVILVDDCSPDPRLVRLVEEAGRRPGVTALRNTTNRGFARSVNRALKLCADGDVLLLNADVLLPPTSVSRLREIVASDPSVGTATPFSNNGQTTSFPRPFLINPMPDAASIGHLDGIAESVNGQITINVPSGIGFCLYISGRCLAAVARLPEHYGRGYYEDVEFCLQAARKGFRNVCATGIFVGHEGSVSFKSEKKLLTVRNSAILDERFPRQKADFLAFAVADPLRNARAAIERRLALPAGDMTIMVASEGSALWQAVRRATELEEKGGVVLMVTYTPGADCVAVGRPGTGSPSSLKFDLPGDQNKSLLALLKRADAKLIEVFDVVRTPDALLDVVLKLSIPIEIFGVELSTLRGGSPPRGGPCLEIHGSEVCATCREGHAGGSKSAIRREREARLVRVLSAARSVGSLDRMGAAFSKRIFGQKAAPFESPPVAPMAIPPSSGKPRLGILAPAGASRECDRIAVRLARRLAVPGEDRRLVLIGSSYDEDSLLATGAAWVTGPAEPGEYVRLARLYDVTRLAMFDRLRLFGPLDDAARQLALPKAYFDWSFGALNPDAGDLAMDPRICDDKAAGMVALWLNAD